MTTKTLSSKKISTSVISFLWILGLTAPLAFAQTTQPDGPIVTPDQTDAFSDVHVGDDHFMAIKFLKDRHIIDGYSDGTFQPEKQINRAEALKIILGTINKVQPKTAATSTTAKTFSDVPSDAWYAPYVQKGVANDIVGGYPDGTFQPEKTINKVESLKMVLLEENHELPVTIDQPPYNDVPVDVWFAPYAQVSQDRGLFLETRSGGDLNGDEMLNRGDFAELIYRLLESSNNYHFGRATYYADALAGHGTSSGDPYNPAVYTTAHKTLPLGTELLVTNLANGQQVKVKVNDRGPYATGVELDLSKSAFAAIASPSAGIIVTQFQILSEPS